MDIMMDMDMLGHVTCCYIYVLWFCMGMCYVCAAYAVLLCVGGVVARPKKASSTKHSVLFRFHTTRPTPTYSYTFGIPRRPTLHIAAAPAPGRTPR